MRTFWNYKSPLGSFTLQCEDEFVLALKFGQHRLDGTCKSTITSNRAAQQIIEYFAGKRMVFDIPYSLNCSREKEILYKYICRIPYGTSLSYESFLAQYKLTSSKRLLIEVCKENPLPLIMPSHRICGKHSLGVYCASAEAKQYFLALEQQYSRLES